MTGSTVIIGAGFTGKTYGAMLAARGERVIGTTRSASKAEALSAHSIIPILFDGKSPDDDLIAAIRAASAVIISIAPDETGDPVLNAMSDAFENLQRKPWLAYLSTVGVYGNHDGAWVEETTPPKPVSTRSIHRVQAENAWIRHATTCNMPLAILRLSGIYGPGRNQMVALAEGRSRRLVKPGQVFNRIHVQDIARALDHLAACRADGVFNVTDDCPAPPQDVVAYCASVMKVDPPEAVNFETATLSPMARSFYGENKRVSNAKIKSTGFAFSFPDYRTAFKRMWEEDSWR